MAEPVLCGVCGRDPKRTNNEHYECSHVDCPRRRHQWSDGTPPAQRQQDLPLGEKQLDHLCVNASYCNVDHLDPVTASENCKRRSARRVFN